jgi:predicted methyltransferase
LPAPGPLLTLPTYEALLGARRSGAASIVCSLDLGRSTSTVSVGEAHWGWGDARYPYPETCKDRTIYHWTGAQFAPVARYTHALVKLVPTEWGAPTFEIDGIKMLPTSRESPYEDARRKVDWIQPAGKTVLDTCGGLGYFAAWCIAGGASRVTSFENNPDVLWLRGLNPWSPGPGGALELTQGDVVAQIAGLATGSFDAALHDPPRFGIAGDLYSQAFYDQLARVLKPKGKLFHYTGTPNRLTTGRDVPREVARRLQLAGFRATLEGDGVLAVRTK